MKRVLGIVLLLVTVHAHAATITLDDYTRTLDRIHAQLAAHQLPAAKAEAARLQGAEVLWAEGRFHADDMLLSDIGRATRADRRLLERIDLTLRELRGSGASSVRSDPKLLQEVAAAQEVAELVPGGEVKTAVSGNTTLLEQIAGSIARMFRWLSETIARILEWIVDLFPSRRPQESAATFGLRWIIFFVVALIVIVLAVLAVGVMRRSRRAQPETVESAGPIGSKRDEDPLSRGPTEWERYAARLAGEGRYREAIRAWYHAVLVTCYATGVLHFRKGRTNWEYIATLAPSYDWRAELIQLTRRFELEWYGHRASGADALDECSRRAQRILQSLRQRGAA